MAVGKVDIGACEFMSAMAEHFCMYVGRVGEL